MNAVEFKQCMGAVEKRMRAVTNGARKHDVPRAAAVAVFAGTELPAEAVLKALLSDRLGNTDLLLAAQDLEGVLGIVGALQVNAFILGFEAGRRSS